jgi:hypothetical protein
LWIGSVPFAGQESRWAGHPLVGLDWAGVSSTWSFVVVQPPWKVW